MEEETKVSEATSGGTTTTSSEGEAVENTAITKESIILVTKEKAEMSTSSLPTMEGDGGVDTSTPLQFNKDTNLSRNPKSPLARVNPSKLERKHSSGDLHSRLKTRKMLGVGETENGDIHRSKISQVLGHNEHLYLKLPRGYWTWQAFLAAILAFQGTFILVFPDTGGKVGLLGACRGESNTSSPSLASSGSCYYAVTMLALAYLLWKFLHFKDKLVVRTVLTTVLIHFVGLCGVDVLCTLRAGIFATLLDIKFLTMFGLRCMTLTGCGLYLSWMGTPTSGLRKSPSCNKDVNTTTTDNHGSSSGGKGGGEGE